MLILGSDMTANNYGVDDTFGNNSLTTIKAVCQAGAIPTTWAVGDTKEITGKDGNTYHIRLADKQAGRYKYSNSALRTHAVFEFVELPNITTRWASSSILTGGYAKSQVRKNLNGLTGFDTGKNFMTDIIPDDLRALLEEVDIVSAAGDATFTGTFTSANKLFPACYANLAATTSPQLVAEGTLWDYYATHTSGADKKKLQVNTTSYGAYIVASYSSNNASYFVNTNGGFTTTNPSNTYRVAPCWAW